MILMKYGSVWATGDGQLGDGTTVGKKNFVEAVRSGRSYAML